MLHDCLKSREFGVPNTVLFLAAREYLRFVEVLGIAQHLHKNKSSILHWGIERPDFPPKVDIFPAYCR